MKKDKSALGSYKLKFEDPYPKAPKVKPTKIKKQHVRKFFARIIGAVKTFFKNIAEAIRELIRMAM